MNTTVRNVGILLLIALAVVVVPGGGTAANLIGAIFSIVFAVALGYFAGRTYLERRLELYSLDERHRAILYGAIAGLAITFAAASRLLATGPGLLAFVAMLGLAGYGLFYVVAAWRRY